MIIFAPRFDLLPVAGNKPVCNTNSDQMKGEILKKFSKIFDKIAAKGLKSRPKMRENEEK